MSRTPQKGTSGRYVLPIVASLAVLAALSAGLLVSFNPAPSSQADYIIRRLSQKPIDGVRFFNASSFQETDYEESLKDAALFAIAADNPRIQALLRVGGGDLPEALKLLTRLADKNSSDAALVNDLGVVYWGMGTQAFSNYFKALALFERASQLAPQAINPRLNLVLGYRRISLQSLAAQASNDYRKLERFSLRTRELLDPRVQAPLHIKALEDALRANDRTLASQLLVRYPESYRTLAIESTLHPSNETPPSATVEFILEEFANKGHDASMRAILAPLRTDSRQEILHFRKLVNDGIKAYFKSNYDESLRLYNLAEASVQSGGSTFDQLWLTLNRADIRVRTVAAETRLAEMTAVIELLDDVISRAKELKLHWLRGQALVSKAVASAGIKDQDEVIPLLNEAVSTLRVWGMPKDIARPLDYLATIHYYAGDFEKSLGLAYQSLNVTSADDSVRLTQLYSLVGRQIYRLGFQKYGVTLTNQALAEATRSRNPGLPPFVLSVLATMHAADDRAQERILLEAQSLLKETGSAAERFSLALSTNLLCGQVRTAMGRLDEAEACLMENLEVLQREVKAAPEAFPQTLVGLAQIHMLRGEFNRARDRLREATEVIESNDSYFAIAGLRASFENHRRNTYETAIAFEYDHEGRDTAWSDAQRYRAKLFLEFLQQTNPAISGVLGRTIDRRKIPEVMPDNVQVLEYVTLADRLLIWLVSKDKMVSAEVPVSRAMLESKVSSFIELLNGREDIGPAAETLYKWLIGPIEAELHPERTVAVIPDQALHRLTFAALRSPSSGRFLIEQYSLVESPSLATLLAGGGGNATRNQAIAFGARTNNITATIELRRLAELYPGIKVSNGESAQKATFLSSLSDAAILHYAGHSQDASDPLRSAILLDGEREGPNSVTAMEISGRRMPANSVVVLASCDSSVGNSRDGIGMRGLTSAFLISGAGSVVGSLWRVEAESTSSLVLNFHKNLVQRLSVAESLRRAQLSFIKEGAHPYYWSGFVVTGNLSALR